MSLTEQKAMSWINLTLQENALGPDKGLQALARLGRQGIQ
jgi:hypothetical protein